ncbi:SMEK domain-containing protein [Hymenobacter glacieicola]|uniref:SMEK domain-containing protein n=1 Tax=Hymenobacter glacieicola TaxID=1562124 RepID=A0ABQ1WDX6_9BACT|nr:SMEK domain-containing protein [Hymenobacter glacieicola]GGG27209.1 hypothetical protein GCM10011378_00020 [Hymenobacter glacieicola]
MDVRQESMNNIIKKLSYLKTEITLAGSLNLTSSNIYAENFYRDFLNLLGYSYINTNFSQQNAAHIDLVDHNKKQAIQVTSENTNTKISESINGFYKNDEYKDYNLKILLISKEAKDYKTDFTDGGNFNFDHTKDVIDITRLTAIINNEETPKLIQLSNFLTQEIIPPRTETECNEVETIMTLIAYLSNDSNREFIQRKEVADPEKKIYNRFSEHSSFLIERYQNLAPVYYKTLELGRANMDSIQATIISSYLQDESDEMLTKHNNNPKAALRELVNYFADKLSKNGFASYDKQAIHFYLLDEMIKCNVFPMT